MQCGLLIPSSAVESPRVCRCSSVRSLVEGSRGHARGEAAAPQAGASTSVAESRWSGAGSARVLVGVARARRARANLEAILRRRGVVMERWSRGGPGRAEEER